MSTENPEKAKGIERANAYREMVQLWAYKDLMKIVDEIKQDSVRHSDSIQTENLNLTLIAEDRGIRKGLDKLLAEVGYILDYR